MTSTRIGSEYGFGGRVHRIEGETEEGAAVSLIVKEEDRASVERALAFRQHNTEVMGTSIAQLYGSFFEDEGELGVLLLEDMAPCIQGDALEGCSGPQAESVVRALARLHTSSGKAALADVDETLPRWQLRFIEDEVWVERFSLARRRYPEILTSEVAERLVHLPDAVAEAGTTLANGASSWIHGDMHLDNVLFRSDDSVVILDWANATIGPPAVDLAHVFSEGIASGDPESRLAEWLPVYGEEAASLGAVIDLGELRSSIGWAILRLLQGSIGWAGREEDPLPRFLALRENLLRNTCAWLDTDVVPDVV